MRLQHELTRDPNAPPAFVALGGAREVGASCGIVGIGGHRLQIDAGMRWTNEAIVERRTPDPRLPRLDVLPQLGSIDAVFLTHAHADHVNALPVALRGLPRETPIFATPETIQLMEINLLDQVLLASRGIGGPPLYTRDEVEDALRRTRPLQTGTVAVLSLPAGDLAVRPVRAGHILGAVMWAFEAPDDTGGFWRVLHTGDFDTRDALTIRGADLEAVRDFRPHLLISEGTYGVEAHTDITAQHLALLRRVFEVQHRGGTTLLPAFAIGRAQEVAVLFRMYNQFPDAFEAAWKGIAPRPPVLDVCMDGGARRVAEVYNQFRHALASTAQALSPVSSHVFFNGPGAIRALTQHERVAGALREPGRVLIAPSGTLRGGPSETYAKLLVPHTADEIILVGYADEESPGRKLLRLPDLPVSERTLAFDDGDRPLPVHCGISTYRLSAHTGAEGVQALFEAVRPLAATLVHGDDDRLRALRDQLVNAHFGRSITIAPLGAPRDKTAVGRGEPHRKARLMDDTARYRLVLPDPAGPSADQLRSPLILDPITLYQTAVSAQMQNVSAAEVAAVALEDEALDDGVVRLVLDEIESYVGVLWRKTALGYAPLFTPIPPSEAQFKAAGRLTLVSDDPAEERTPARGRPPRPIAAHRPGAWWTPIYPVEVRPGDLVVVRYNSRFPRAAVLGAEVAGPGAPRFHAAVAHSTQTTVRQNDIVVSLGPWEPEAGLPGQSPLEQVSHLMYVPDPERLAAIEPVPGRERLLTWLMRVALGTGDEAVYARAMGRYVVEALELTWTGTPERAGEIAAPLPRAELERWMARRGVLVLQVEQHGPAGPAAYVQIRFAPFIRRLQYADRRQMERLQLELQAWRRAFDREYLETVGGAPMSVPALSLPAPR